MHTPKIALLIALVALATLACSVTVNLPVNKVVTGPMQTEQISIPRPDAQDVNLTLNFGAGRLILAPGETADLISGTAEYNVAELKPKIITSGNDITLESGSLKVRGIPDFEGDVRNKWDLVLGDMPMDLVINGGAYQGKIELGGLPIQTLWVNDGAADVEMSFSHLNPRQMDLFTYSTGASNIRLTGLANANFRNFIFRGGAGSYTLDFSGTLQQDANVTVESGVSSVTIVVPTTTAARLILQGGLSNVAASGGWKKDGNTFQVDGSGPVLAITINMGLGNLTLATR